MLHMFDDKARTLHQFVRLAGEMATIGQTQLERFEPALPAGGAGIVRQPVLEEVEAGPRSHHSMNLRQGGGYVRDGAERERRQGAVAALGLEWDVLPVEADVLDRD